PSLLTLILPLRPFLVFFLHHPTPTQIYTLSLHDALPIYTLKPGLNLPTNLVCSSTWPLSEGQGLRHLQDLQTQRHRAYPFPRMRSEEHTSELQSRFDLVCRLLLEKKNNQLPTIDIVANIH